MIGIRKRFRSIERRVVYHEPAAVPLPTDDEAAGVRTYPLEMFAVARIDVELTESREPSFWLLAAIIVLGASAVGALGWLMMRL
jgi:hypothetical protein